MTDVLFKPRLGGPIRLPVSGRTIFPLYSAEHEELRSLRHPHRNMDLMRRTRVKEALYREAERQWTDPVV